MALAAPTAPADNNIAQTQASNAATAAANPNIFGGSSTTPPAATPTPSMSGINSTNLAPTTPVTLPPPPTPNTSQASGLVAAGQQTSKSVQDYINSLTPTQPTAVDNEQSQLLSTIANLTGQDTGKDQALLDAQNASGATADQASLTALNNQLLTQTAQYNNEQANLGGNGSVETSAVLAAQNAGLTKARAADIGLTTAQIQAMQGNLTLAMNTASEAVDAKYSTIEDNIKTSQAQLAAIQPMLDEEQKTTAAAQSAYLAEQAQQVADQKATETQINTVALQAASAGASSDVIAAINNSPDVISAIAAAAPALGAAATAKLQQQQFDNNVTLQQLAISKAQEGISAENAATSRETATLDQQKLINEMSPQALLQYAQQYQATGVMPAQAVSDGLSGAVNAIATGQGTKDGQPAIPLAPGTIYNTTTQVADSKLTPDQENNISQLYNVVNNILPQLTTNFAQNSGIDIGDPQAQQTIQDYNDTVASLKSVLATMNTAGILKSGTGQLEALIPSSNWGLNTGAGKRDIANLTSQITTQLQSYLSTNGLSIAGFTDTTEQTGVNSPNSLSQFAK